MGNTISSIHELFVNTSDSDISIERIMKTCREESSHSDTTPIRYNFCPVCGVTSTCPRHICSDHADRVLMTADQYHQYCRLHFSDGTVHRYLWCDKCGDVRSIRPSEKHVEHKCSVIENGSYIAPNSFILLRGGDPVALIGHQAA